jgi:hypothetical protein
MSFSKDELDKLKPLFWEYKWESVKENLASPVVIARVLEMANPEQFKIFSSAVGDTEIIKFLKTKGERMLSKRSFNFWKLYYEKKSKKIL